MTVTSVNASAQPDYYRGVGKKELDRDDFMTLFVTQLQYQDPLKPLDTYEMASQLAQFSNMEATMKMSDNMEELLAYQTSQNNLQLLTLLNKQVGVSGNQLSVLSGNVSAGEFTLEESAEACVVKIYDQSGTLIQAINKGQLNSGTYRVGWDGSNFAGTAMGDGAYTFVVEAINGVGEEVGIATRSFGTVTGVDFDSGKAMLTVDGHVRTGVGDVLTVM